MALTASDVLPPDLARELGAVPRRVIYHVPGEACAVCGAPSALSSLACGKHRCAACEAKRTAKYKQRKRAEVDRLRDAVARLQLTFF
jgi:hypothetical protein